MNRKQLTILLVLVALVGGAGLVVYQRQKASWTKSDAGVGTKLLGDFPVNDVAHILIQQGTNELNLAKQDELWRVRERNDYPANYADISQFLLKARDLKIVQSEQVGPSQLPRLELAPPGQGTNSALLVEFKDKNEKPIQTLLLGKKHMNKSGQPSAFGEGDEGWPDGRYVKVGSNAENVALISDPLDNIEPKPEQWLDKDFFKVEKAKTIAVTFPSATNSWKLARETESGEWKLADAKPGEQLDSAKIAGVSNPLSSPSFADVSASARPGEMDKPTIVTIDTFDHFTYTVKVGQKTNDDYPLTVAVTAQIPQARTPGKDEKPDDKARLDKEFKDQQQKLEEKMNREKGCEKWVYLVSSWVVDPLLKERSQLLMEKKEESKNEATPTAAKKSETNSVSSAVNALH